MYRKIKAVIPVRSGSVRVPNKNIRPFAGSSLLEICIDKLKSLDLDVVVNTDSYEMIDIAKSKGVEYHKRPVELALSSTKPTDLSKYIAEVTDSDLILYVHCTSPLISTETIKRFIDTDWTGHDSLNSVSLVKKHLWFEGRPLNYEAHSRPNTQELPDIYALNYSFNLIEKNVMIKRSDFVGCEPYLFLTPDEESIDIDTPTDFSIAEKLYGKL